ncbi:serine hydrolase domain-containing protein [Chitinophaga caseinilytica]|uniref:Serine hydrolase domain-containing protein n=1 Tax=Chitinophaga caseinilytica TaxID=2267521 RepID=A0ABZ2YYK5_9BACT
MYFSCLRPMFVTVMILLLTQPALAQTPRFASDNPMRSGLDSAVDQRVQRYLKDERVVGLSLGILINDKPYFYNYGETKVGNHQLPTDNTIYEIGSITKTFTGILLAQAVLDKKLALDDDIRKYLPGQWPNLTFEGVPIRVRDLSNHTARVTRIFRNLWDRPAYDSLNPLHDYTRAMLYEGLHAMKMDTFPGKISSYSNMGAALLGTMLEDAYGQSWFALVSKNILQPLGMKSTRIDVSGVPASAIAWPHNDRRETVPLWDMAYLPAMGSLRSTTRDLMAYLRANNSAASPAIALSHQPTYTSEKESLGLNWFLPTSPDGHPMLEHTGGTGGSRSSLDCFPTLKSGFIILTNSLANRKDLEKELVALVTEKARP